MRLEYEGALSIEIRRLVLDSAGRHWAIVDGDELEEALRRRGAYPIDPTLLESQPDTAEGEAAYHYRGVFRVRQ